MGSGIVLRKKLYLAVIIVLILAIIVEAICIFSLNAQIDMIKKGLVGQSGKFNLLSPQIAWLDLEDFLEKQKTLTTSYAYMRPSIEGILKGTNGTYGVYFEDLTTGAWVGINERSKFVPASLLKLPILVAALKKVETGEIKLNDVVTLEQEDIDYRSGYLAYKGVGHKTTVKELLIYLMNESDNTALKAIGRRYLQDEDIQEANLAMGLPIATPDETISPKEYSSIFRSLYHSSYLRRTFSETALSILLETGFTDQLPAGVPKNIQISHKVGIYYDEEQFGPDRAFFHDCGIIYIPEKPYILCVMSRNSTREESNNVISQISSSIYESVNSRK